MSFLSKLVCWVVLKHKCGNKLNQNICVVVKMVLTDGMTGRSFNKCMHDPITGAVRSWGLPQPPPFEAPALFLLHEANRN